MSAIRIAEVWCDIDDCDNKVQAEDGDNITELRAFLRDNYGWDYRCSPATFTTSRRMIDICPDCIDQDPAL